MLKRLNESDSLKFSKLDSAEKSAKGILGRLYGPVASFNAPTRNGRKYGQELWEKLFESDLIKERFENGGIFGELCHPDYEEVDMNKVACIMPEPPTKNSNGELVAYVDILDTPCGKIAYQLAKYGFKFGISSRGTGDLIDGVDGEEVDPDTYQLNAFDLVEVPAVKSARLTFTESLNTKKYGKTLRDRLNESVNKANKDEKKIMLEALEDLGIDLEESKKDPFWYAWTLDGDEVGEVGYFPDKESAYEEAEKLYQDYADELTVDIDFDHEDLNESSAGEFAIIVKDSTGWHIWGATDKEAVDADWLDRVNEQNATYAEKAGEPVDVYTDVRVIPNGGEEYEAVYNGTYEQPVEEMLISKKRERNGLYDEEFDAKLEERFDPRGYTAAIRAISDGIETDEDVPALTEYLENIIRYCKSIADDYNIQLNEECNGGSCSDKNKADEEVVFDKSEVLVEFQEALKMAKKLKKDNLDLQEKLSVCNAKEIELSKQVNDYKSAVTALSGRAKSVKQIKESLNKKDETIKKQVKKIHELNKLTEGYEETITERNMSILKLKESISKVNEQNKKLTENLEKSKAMVNKYQKSYSKLKENYIDRIANQYGVEKSEVKAKLTESYNISDVEEVCKKLTRFKTNMNKLPFRLNEGTKLKATTTQKPVGIESDDDISETLLRLVD